MAATPRFRDVATALTAAAPSKSKTESEKATSPASSSMRDLPIFWKLLLPFLLLLLVVGSAGAFIIVRDLTLKSAATLSEQLTLRALDARSLIHHRELDLLESVNYATNLEGMVEGVAAERTAEVTALLRSVSALKSDLAIVAATNERAASLAEFVRAQPGAAPVAGSGGDWSNVAPVKLALAGKGKTKTAGFVRVNDRPLMMMVAPVCRGGAACTPVGYAIVGLDATRVARGIATATNDDVRGAQDVTLYTTNGSVVTSTTKAPPAHIKVTGTTEIAQRRMNIDGRELATAYTGFVLAGRKAGTLAVTIPSTTAFGSVGPAAMRLVGLLLAAMAAAVAVGAFISRRILRQLRGLVNTSRKLGEGELSARARVLSGDEHGELAVSLNRMADQLQASHETLELQVEQRTEEIHRLLRDRTEFFAGLSHELRTPLAVILTQADMLVGTNGSRATRDEASATIRESATQLLDVVNDILDLARAEAGSVDVDLRTIRLASLMDDLEPMLVRLGAASGVEVRVALPARLPAVTADPGRLREVLVNLVDNAIKYTPSGGTIDISAERDGDEVRVAVADTGVGIPADVGDRVFEPFYRVSGTRPQRAQPSSGLGLALTRRWVEAQGGTIGWEPNPGGGTIFSFTIPIGRTRSQSRGPKARSTRR